MANSKWKLENADKMKEYRRKHYRLNKQSYIDRSSQTKDRLREILRGVKDVPCMDCGIKYPYYVMDLDHRDSGTKECNPAKLVTMGSISKLLVEIAKCDVVCANCHRQRTHNRGLYSE